LDLSSISFNTFGFGPYAATGYSFIDELFTQFLGLLFDLLELFLLQTVCDFALLTLFFQLQDDLWLVPASLLFVRLLLLLHEELIKD